MIDKPVSPRVGDTVKVNADNVKKTGITHGKVTALRGGPTYYEAFVAGAAGTSGKGAWFHHSTLEVQS